MGTTNQWHGTTTGVPGQGQPQVLTSKLLICQALLVGQEEGEEPIQASRGPTGDDVKEDRSVEDLEDRRWVRSWPLRAWGLLPVGQAPLLGTAVAASVSHLCNELEASQLPVKGMGTSGVTRGVLGSLPLLPASHHPVSTMGAAGHLASCQLAPAVF